MHVAIVAAIALLAGCRWVFGIDDTTVAGETDAAPPDAEIAPIDALRRDAMFCPNGYVERAPGSCHRMVGTPADWLAAELDCETAGAHLVVIDDPAELFSVPAIDQWVGLSERVVPGFFQWVTDQGATLDPPWATGEPVPGGASCVTYETDGFHDDQCDEGKPYVCEFDRVAADPGNF